MSIDRLLLLLTEDQPNEQMDYPYRDAAQETWLHGLTWLKASGVDISDIQTVDDLRNKLQGKEEIFEKYFQIAARLLSLQEQQLR